MIKIPDKILPKELRRKRLVIFIDGNHLFHRSRYWYGTHDIDIFELSNRICTINRELVQIRYYYSPFVEQVNKDNYIAQDIYVKNTSRNPSIKTISGNYIKKPIVLPEEMMQKLLAHFDKNKLFTYIEKGIDVAIAVDMVAFAHEKKFQDMVLISGDSDFVPAITEVMNLNKKVQVAAYSDEENSCTELKNSCRSFINLHNLIPKLTGRKKKAVNQKAHGSL